MGTTYRLRVSVIGLFIDAGEVLLIHQMTPPEPDCWDLPGGGLEPHEELLVGLQREIQEETGVVDFQVDRLLTVIEDFFPCTWTETLHTVNIVYLCSVPDRSAHLSSTDPEIGTNGIQWIAIHELVRQECSNRCWKALQAGGYIF